MKEFGIHSSYEGIFIIVLCSKWCKSCKLFAPILGKFRDNGSIMFKEIDIDENRNLVRELNIYAVPALLFFKDGKLLNKNIKINEEIFVNKGVMIGTFGEQILKEIIRQV
ncbi:MAG: thioredoxin family protein [Promethearchaeota archaeon]